MRGDGGGGALGVSLRCTCTCTVKSWLVAVSRGTYDDSRDEDHFYTCIHDC